MPVRPELKPLYPGNGDEISRRIRSERARGRCEWCSAENHKPHPATGSRVVLSVTHLDHGRRDNDQNNLAILCQRCHSKYAAAGRRADSRRRAHSAEGQPRPFTHKGDKL